MAGPGVSGLSAAERQTHKINEAHKGEKLLHCRRSTHHGLKIVERVGSAGGNYSHCGEALLLRFLLKEFHLPSFFLVWLPQVIVVRQLILDFSFANLLSELRGYLSLPDDTVQQRHAQLHKRFLTDKAASFFFLFFPGTDVCVCCSYLCVISAWWHTAWGPGRCSCPGRGRRSGPGGSTQPCASDPSESACGSSSPCQTRPAQETKRHWGRVLTHSRTGKMQLYRRVKEKWKNYM